MALKVVELWKATKGWPVHILKKTDSWLPEQKRTEKEEEKEEEEEEKEKKKMVMMMIMMMKKKTVTEWFSNT